MTEWLKVTPDIRPKDNACGHSLNVFSMTVITTLNGRTKKICGRTADQQLRTQPRNLA